MAKAGAVDRSVCEERGRKRERKRKINRDRQRELNRERKKS